MLSSSLWNFDQTPNTKSFLLQLYESLCSHKTLLLLKNTCALLGRTKKPSISRLNCQAGQKSNLTWWNDRPRGECFMKTASHQSIYCMSLKDSFNLWMMPWNHAHIHSNTQSSSAYLGIARISSSRDKWLCVVFLRCGVVGFTYNFS